MAYRLIIFVSLFTLIIGLTYGQQTNKVIDSLNILLKSAKDTSRVNILNDIAFEYVSESPETANKYSNEALKLSEKLNFTNGQIIAYNNLGLAQYYSNNYDKALEFYNKVFLLSQKSGNKVKEATALNNIGLVFDDKADYTKALEYYLKALTIVEKENQQRLIANITNNVALIYQNQGKYDLALDYHLKSLKIKEKIKNARGIGSSLHNIGLVYKLKGEYDKSLEYYFRALQARKANNDDYGTAQTLNNIGSVYESKKQYEKSTPYFEQSLKIQEKLKDQYHLAITLFSIGSNYINLKSFEKGYAYIGRALGISKEIGAKELLRYGYEVLSYSYSQTKNFEKAYEYQKLFIQVKDSILNAETSKQINELQTKYESEKKQKEIELLNKGKELQKTEIKRQTTQKYALIAGIVFMIFLSLIILKSYRDKRRANIKLKQLNNEINQQKSEIEEKNEELHQQNEEITTQRDEIEAQRDEISGQRDLVMAQKEQLEKIHKEVKDSINYAQRIQEAVLPMDETSRSVLGKHFILFKPRDVVSGDFYWFTQKENQLFIAIADCTGHGVPGAFMSMLGISFLNEIMSHNTFQTPAQILEEMRHYVISSMQQHATDDKAKTLSMKDGMDMALISIDKDTFKMQYAGANNPVYIIKYSPVSLSEVKDKGVEKTQTSNCSLIELKPDKMPIAIHVNMAPFTNQEVQLEKGDSVYLFSDGFADQFGGKHGKKLMYKPFKELIFSNFNKPIEEQGPILENALENWKGSFEQTDDIIVMGIKL